MGRNNSDFNNAREPELKDVIRAHVGGKITHEEASGISEAWNTRAVAAHGGDTKIMRKDKEERPALRPTSDARRKAIHKKAGLSDE
jgi:hypothetical protein